MGKKFVFYLKENTKSIVLTDVNENRNLDEVKEILTTQMNTDGKLFTFETENDIIVCKLDSLQAIHVSELNNKSKSNIKKENDIINMNSEIFLGDSLEFDESSNNFEITHLTETDDISIEENDNNE